MRWRWSRAVWCRTGDAPRRAATGTPSRRRSGCISPRSSWRFRCRAGLIRRRCDAIRSRLARHAACLSAAYLAGTTCLAFSLRLADLVEHARLGMYAFRRPVRLARCRCGLGRASSAPPCSLARAFATCCWDCSASGLSRIAVTHGSDNFSNAPAMQSCAAALSGSCFLQCFSKSSLHASLTACGISPAASAVAGATVDCGTSSAIAGEITAIAIAAQIAIDLNMEPPEAETRASSADTSSEDNRPLWQPDTTCGRRIVAGPRFARFRPECAYSNRSCNTWMKSRRAAAVAAGTRRASGLVPTLGVV